MLSAFLAFVATADVRVVFADEIEFELQTEIAASTAFARDALQKSELSIKPRFDLRFSGGSKLTGIGFARNDFSERLEPGKLSNDVRSPQSSRIALGTHADIELRELYLDFEIGEIQIRLGKQQVVWGQADGLRVLDAINPLSYREFILSDLEDRRIPLWMVNAEVGIGSTMLQLLWITDQSYDEFPLDNAAFAFTAPQFRPAFNGQQPDRIRHLDKPNNWLTDSDVGLRLSAFTNGWDLTANYLYHFQDQPVLAIDHSTDTIVLSPTYRRTHLLGGSASKAMGDFVFRSEFGYSSHRYFTSLNKPNGIEETYEYSVVLGLDYSGITDLFISGQFFQSTVASNRAMLRTKNDKNISLLGRRDFANNTLSVEVLAIHNTNASDGLVQAELAYQLSSNLTLSIGADVFYGNSEGLFGQFDRRDRLSLKLEIGL